MIRLWYISAGDSIKTLLLYDFGGGVFLTKYFEIDYIPLSPSSLKVDRMLLFSFHKEAESLIHLFSCWLNTELLLRIMYCFSLFTDCNNLVVRVVVIVVGELEITVLMCNTVLSTWHKSTYLILRTVLLVVSTIIILILQVKKLRHRIITELIQGHIASKWELGFKSRQSGFLPEFVLFTTFVLCWPL